MSKIFSIICIAVLALYTTQLSSYAKTPKKSTKPPKCPSGIISEHNQCWVCSKESREPIRKRVEIAKTKTNQLGGCNNKMILNELQERKKWWQEFGEAREAENKCWEPKHSAHETMARRAFESANKCEDFLNEQGK